MISRYRSVVMQGRLDPPVGLWALRLFYPSQCGVVAWSSSPFPHVRSSNLILALLYRVSGSGKEFADTSGHGSPAMDLCGDAERALGSLGRTGELDGDIRELNSIQSS